MWEMADYYFDLCLWMDIEKDMDIDRRFNQWNEWFHIDRKWNKYLINEMTTQHLINTITLFKKSWYNVSPLSKEYKKRNK